MLFMTSVDQPVYKGINFAGNTNSKDTFKYGEHGEKTGQCIGGIAK
jgi:hypothetical protein